MIQAASDIFLGYARWQGPDGASHDHYIRQLWDGKGKFDVERMGGVDQVYASGLREPEILISPNAQALAARGLLASDVADLIRKAETEGRKAVLGLATGSTPVPFYRELIRLHREEGLSFKNVVTFNLED